MYWFSFLFFNTLGFLFLLSQYACAQPISMDEAVALAKANHPLAINAALTGKKDMIGRKNIDFGPTNVKYWHRQTRHNGNDHMWSVTQDFGVIPEHIRNFRHQKLTALANSANIQLTIDELEWNVKDAYFETVYYGQRLQIMRDHYNFYEALISTAEIYLSADSIPELEKVSAGAKYAAYHSRLFIAEEELKRSLNRLQQLLYCDIEPEIMQKELQLYQVHPSKNFEIRFEAVKHQARDKAEKDVVSSLVSLEKSKLFPAIHAGYINQQITGVDHFNGWMVGLSVPVWNNIQRSKIKQTEIDMQVHDNEMKYNQYVNDRHVENLQSLLNEYFIQISFSKENLLEEASLVLSDIELSFSNGNISDYSVTFGKVTRAMSVKLDHINFIYRYNQTALELEYYTQ